MSQKSTPPGGSVGTAVFILAVFLSAFLLFQVQPIIARYILPWYGGSPSVWSACMLFFQLGLVVGYGYAHLLVSAFRERRALQIGIHFALVVLAVVTLPITPDPAMKPGSDETMPLFGILLLLARTVGIPYVILSASGPLVQHWFSRIYPDRSPFRLYAVSNFGSLLALLSYPFLFEVHLTISNQSILWSFGFGFYALVLGVTAYLFSRLRAGAASGKPETEVPFSAKPDVVPGVTRYMRWILFSACGSVLLLAVTNQICQDVAVVPFLWILPLSLYLLSFIIAFDHSRWYHRPFVIPAAGISISMVVIVLNQYFETDDLSIVWQIAIFCGALFFACLVCHGEIVRLKPSPRFLTQFYLAVSVGGALGGIFVNLIAPVVFDSYYELHLGILLLAILMTWQVSPHLIRLFRRDPAGLEKRSPTALFMAGVAGLVWCAASGFIVIGLYTHSRGGKDDIVSSSRGFFGILKVKESRAETGQLYRVLVHGQIDHGLQFLDPELGRLPTTYYAKNTGIGSVFEFIPQRFGRPGGNLHVGVVGLGVGTLAAYALPGDRFRFYEINSQVDEYANSHFTYLKDSRGEVETVLGDGRISLDRELAQSGGHDFDILVVDAFSGDSIPIHLLTDEAFDLYVKHLKEDGVIAMNISNNHLDLSDPLRILAEKNGMAALRLSTADDNGIVYSAAWVIITRCKPLIRNLYEAGRVYKWPRTEPKALYWSDDFNNLLRVLR